MKEFIFIYSDLLYAAVVQEGNFRVVLVDKEPDNSSLKVIFRTPFIVSIL